MDSETDSRRRTNLTRRYIPPAPPPRTFRSNVLVAVALSTVAGWLNAGGFFAVGVYTANVTGTWSRAADEIALGNGWVALKCALFVVAFIAGAALSTFLIEHDPETARRVRYLKPLVLEIFLLGAFVVLGGFLMDRDHPLAKYMMFLLFFTMGLQNAMVTKISNAAVRTTHVTGLATDLGIEVTRLSLFTRERWRARRADLATLPPPHPSFGAFASETLGCMQEEGQKAALLLSILFSYGIGGTGGAFSFLKWGYIGASPIALVLALLVAYELYAIRTGATEGVLTGPASRKLDARRLDAAADLASATAAVAPAVSESVGQARSPLPDPEPEPSAQVLRARAVARRFRAQELEAEASAETSPEPPANPPAAPPPAASP